MKHRFPIILVFLTTLAVLLVALLRVDNNPVDVSTHSIAALSPVPHMVLPAANAPEIDPTGEKKDAFLTPLGGSRFSGAGIPMAAAPVPQQLTLQLDDGTQMDFTLTGKDVRGTENYSWMGEVDEQPGSMVVLTRYEDAVDIHVITLDRGELKVRGEVGGSLQVSRVHLEKGFCATCRTTQSNGSGAAGFHAESGEGFVQAPEIAALGALASTNSVIEMLVVYSQRARAAIGGTAAMNAAINNAVASLNNTLANSEVEIAVRLVHSAELQYDVGAPNDGGVSTGLSRLSNPSDGHIDEAITLRNAYGADLVAFAIASTSGLGIANITAPWSCIDVNVSFAGVAPHEWGHNLGCGHNDSGTGQTNLQGEYSYSYAHYFPYAGGTNGTIMSYIGSRIARFSNPNVLWNGIATGTAGRDHALTMENTKLFMDLDSDGDGTSTADENAVGRDPDDGKAFFGFSTDGEREEWSSLNISNITVSGGLLDGIATSGDPQLHHYGFYFPGSCATTALIRMQAETNSAVDVFWGNEGADNFAGSRKVSVDYTGGGAFQVLDLDLSSDTNWTDQTVTRLRIDPLKFPAVIGKSYSIDWIALTDGDFDGDGIADATDGYGDADGDGLPDFAETEADGDGMADAAELAADRDHTNAADMAFHFEADGEFEGWINSPMNITGLTVSNGVVLGTAVTADPYFANYSLGFLSSQVPSVTVRMRAGANAGVQLFWAPEGGGFAGNFLTENYTGNGDWRVVEFTLTGNANWDGKTIDRLRIDPIGSAGAWFEIDWIRAVNGDADLDGFTDAEETGDSDSDGIDDYLDEDSDNDGFLDWEEFLVGTDHTNAVENAFLVDMAPLGVEVDGKTGRLYSLQSKTNLFIPAWVTLDSRGPLVSDQLVIFTNTLTETVEFFRVLVELP